MAFVRVEGLSVHFPVFRGWFRRARDVVRAVDDISFTIDKGEIVGVIGESGSGKSTLAKALLRLVEPTNGQVFVDAHDITTLSRKKLMPFRKMLQIVFQNPSESLNMRKTVGQTLLEVIAFHKITANEMDALEFSKKLLEKVGLDTDLLHYFPHELSIGQKQRVSIARALCTGPKLIVLDECTSALDILVQAQVLNLLLELHGEQKLSYLFISHDLSVVRHIADTVLVMYKGKIVERGPVDEVFSSPQHPYTQKLLESALL